MPRRSQVVLPSSPSGIVLDLATATIPGTTRPVYVPEAEFNSIYIPGVTGGATVTLQIGSWGTSQYSSPTHVGDTLRVIVTGQALIGYGLGFWTIGSSPDVPASCSYYASLEFTYLGDSLESPIGMNGGWAITSGFVDGWPLGF